MIKKVLVLIFTFLLTISIAVAQEQNYSVVGDLEGDFLRGEGIFNLALTSDSSSSKPLVSGSVGSPLTADLDGDGVNEIVILDGENIRLFGTSDLNIIETFPIPTRGGLTERFSNMQLIDIDSDGKTEIIIGQEISNHILIIEYNGTDIFIQQLHNLSTSTSRIGSFTSTMPELVLKCSEANKCIAIYPNTGQSGIVSSQSNVNIHAIFFNSTFIGNEELIDLNSAGTYVYCLPRNRVIAIADYDNDGVDEFITSFMKADITSGDEEISIYYLSLLSNNSVIDENEFVDTSPNNIFQATSTSTIFTCSDLTNLPSISIISTILPAGNLYPKNLFTSPIVFNSNIATGDGEETFYGHMIDTSGSDFDFRIRSLNGCGGGSSCALSELDDYPETCDFPIPNCGKAHTLSNIFRTNSHTDSGVVDFCVSGISFGTSGGIDTICGSEQGTAPLIFGVDSKTKEITLDQSEIGFNISTALNDNVNMWHAVDEDESVAQLEVMTPFGVMRIADVTTNAPTWEIIFPFTATQRGGATISADVENQNSEDIIILTQANIIYIDDGLTNKPAIIRNRSFNPCPINAILKINTTMDVTIIVVDQNPTPLAQDPVSGRVTVYNGDSNAQSQEFGNVSSGAELQFTNFQLNKTIVNGEILLEGFDQANPNIIDSQTINFNVQPNGVEFGDTECSQSFLTAVEEEALVDPIDDASLTVDATDNAVTNAITTLSGLLGLAGTTIWIIIMLTLSIGVWGAVMNMNNNGASVSGSSALGLIAIINVLMIILGARFGIFSTGLIVILVALGIVIIGVFLGRYLTGLRGAAE